MAQIGLFMSICNIFCLCSNPSSVWTRRYLVCVTQNDSSEPGEQWFSGTRVAQNPCRSVSSGMTREHVGPEPGGTLVKPRRRAPCHPATQRSTRTRTFSPTRSGRLLKVTPWRNDTGLLVTRRSPALSFTSRPLTSGWKVSGPRQLMLHVHDWRVTARKTETLLCYLKTIIGLCVLTLAYSALPFSLWKRVLSILVHLLHLRGLS